MSSKTVKTAITIPQDLLAQLDSFVERTGVRSRSKVIAEALRQYLTEHAWMMGEARFVEGVLLLIYNEKQGETVHRVLDAQHEHLKVARFSLHVHLTRDRCLEVLFVSGAREDVTRLIGELSSVRGVEYTRFIPVSLR